MLLYQLPGVQSVHTLLPSIGDLLPTVHTLAKLQEKELSTQFTKNAPNGVVPGAFFFMKGCTITLKFLQPFEQTSIG